jgi:hypothetical protein
MVIPEKTIKYGCSHAPGYSERLVTTIQIRKQRISANFINRAEK